MDSCDMSSEEEIPDETSAIKSTLPIGPNTKILASSSPLGIRRLSNSGIPKPHQSSTLSISLNKVGQIPLSNRFYDKGAAVNHSHRTSAVALPRPLMQSK